MKRLALVLASGSLALGLLVGVPAPSQAALKKVGNLTLSTRTVQRGDVAVARGWVPPRASRVVVLQRKVSWGWASLGRAKTSAKGTFKISFEADWRPGRAVLRVVAPRRTIKGKVYRMVKTRDRRLVVDPGPQPAPGDIAAVTAGANTSDRASLSGDGRFVVFDSLAPDLVPGDTNNYQDVFVRDRETGATIAVTNGHGTSYARALSADGRFVLFDSYASSLVEGDTNQARDVFVYDQATGAMERLTDGDSGSYAGGISADGRYVAFYSYATDLAPDDTNGYRDVFLYDRETDTVTKLTAGNGAALNPSISADGLWVSFYSGASNLVAGDRNRNRDVFLYDVATATTTRVTNGNAASYTGSQALSGDGRYLAFWSDATDLVDGDTNERSDIFVHDRTTGLTTRIVAGDNHSQLPAVSTDGQHIAFESYASNIAPGTDTNGLDDVFVWDAATGIATRITDGAGPSYNPAVSADGGVVAFTSQAGTLAPGDTNNLADVFVWVRR